MSQNKLEEYRNKKANLYKDKKFRGIPRLEETCKELSKHDFANGFDAAIALDLPVKFAEWRDDNCSSDDKIYWTVNNKHQKGFVMHTLVELYQYWIDNVYKPE